MLLTIILAVVALGIAAVGTACAASFRARMLIPTDVPIGSVALVLPATGPLPGLEALFRALRAQTLQARRVIVAVATADDPAYRRVVDLAAKTPVPAVEVVIAGASDRRAQKCTNILAALRRLDDRDAFVVLFDADTRPQPWWLAALIGPLAAGRADIVNGYRWQTPRRVSAAALFGATIDRAIATQPRLGGLRLLWGGSLAISRRALAAIDMPATLARAMTEDLPIADRAAALGLRIMTRHGLRLPTPLDGTLGALWRFGRRQYQLIHLYRPALWAMTAALLTADLTARAGLVAVALDGEARAGRVAIGALVGLAAVGSLGVELRRAIGRRLGVADAPRFTAAQHLLVWATLPLAAFHASLVWAAAIRSPVTWAQVRYVVDRRGRVVAAARASAGLAGNQQELE